MGDRDAALRVLWWLVSGTGDGVVRLWSHEDGRRVATTIRDSDHLLGMVARLGEEHELGMFAAARHPRRLGVAKDGIRALWVRVESKAAAARLRRFPLRPTLVIGEGRAARETAFWALRTPHNVEQAQRANNRLAYHLRCRRGGRDAPANPDEFTFAPPGTLLREGRKRPVPVTVRRLGAERYAARRLYGWLRDPPDPDAWRNR
jgi:hypothetical protein